MVSQSTRRASDRGSGLFGYSHWDDRCYAWSDEQKDERFDPMTRASRAFGVLTALTTGLSLMSMFALVISSRPQDEGGLSSSSHQDWHKPLWKAIGISYALAMLFEILTLVLTRLSSICNDFYSNHPYCNLGPMGYAAAVNVFLLFITCILVSKTPLSGMSYAAVITGTHAPQSTEGEPLPTVTEKFKAFLQEFKL